MTAMNEDKLSYAADGCRGASVLTSTMRRCRHLRARCVTSACVSICSKAFLVIVNFIFLVTGWAVFSIGVWMHVYRETFVYGILLRDNPTNPLLVLDDISLILIIVGGIIVTVSFLGCWGACAESVCFLAFYAFLLLLAVTAQVCAAALASSFTRKILDDLDASMHYQIKYEYNATATYSNRTDTDVYRVTTAWDTLQVQLNCCGASGPQNYFRSSWYNHTSFTVGEFVPATCCVMLNDDPRHPVLADANQCQIEAIAANLNPNASQISSVRGSASSGRRGSLSFTDESATKNVKTQGCHAALIDWLNRYQSITSWFIIIIILQIVDFVYACILISWVPKTLNYYSWCENDDFQ